VPQSAFHFSLDAVRSLDRVGKFELMKSVKTVKVAFDDAPAEKSAIQIDDRCKTDAKCIKNTHQRNIRAVEDLAKLRKLLKSHYFSTAFIIC